MICFPADVGDLSLHEEMLDAAQNQWGRLDCLLNNAGISVKNAVTFSTSNQTASTKILPLTPAHRSSLLRHSVSAYWHSRNRKQNCRTARLFCQFHQRHHAGDESRRIYHCQTAVSAAARLFAARLCNEQIGVYEVRPGSHQTDMTIPATAYYDELIAKGLVPWGRWGYPADIASTVRAMAEGKLIYTCGQAVAIDGGLSMPRF